METNCSLNGYSENLRFYFSCFAIIVSLITEGQANKQALRHVMHFIQNGLGL